jgi:hypothetical protein
MEYLYLPQYFIKCKCAIKTKNVEALAIRGQTPKINVLLKAPWMNEL